MRKSSLILLATAIAAAVPAISFAEEPAPANTFTANVGIFSQYIFRGLTQTNGKPALQGGFDYAHASGLYAGVWASNVSWISDFNSAASASLEMDFYGGYKPTFGDFFVDVGVLRYQYPRSYPHTPGYYTPHTTELYLAGGWKTISLKYSHSLGNTFGVCDAQGTYYLDLTGSWPIGDFYILGHAGKQKYKGTCNGVDNDIASYVDYKVEGGWGFAKDWTLAAGYTTTDRYGKSNTPAFYTPPGKEFIGHDQVYGYIKKTF